MKKLRRRLFLLSIIFALITAGAVYVYLNSLDDTPEIEVVTYQVLVAARDIPARTVITEEMVKFIEVTDPPNESLFYQKLGDVVGKYVISKIYSDSQIHVDSIADSLDSDLSLKISGNMRAVSVAIGGSSGVANLVKPGDRVDIAVYLPGISENGQVIRPDIVKIILQNIEVLAIDQDLTTEKEELTDVAEVNVDSGKVYIATFSIPIQEVEKLIFAKDIGLLDIVLRPLEGDYIYTTEGFIWQELLIDDFDQLKDMFPNYEVRSVGEVYIDPNEVHYDKYIYYTVEFGDTLREISMLFYGTEDNYLLLKQVNNIEDENIITAGMGLKIPVLNEWGELVEQN